jgi:hypothetical protein
LGQGQNPKGDERVRVAHCAVSWCVCDLGNVVLDGYSWLPGSWSEHGHLILRWTWKLSVLP